MKFAPEHIPLIGLVVARVEDLINEIPNIIKILTFIGTAGGLYVGLSVQNARLDERIISTNHMIARIQVIVDNAHLEMDANRQAIAKIKSDDRVCEQRLTWMEQQLKEALKK